MLSPDELKSIQTTWMEKRDNYALLSDYVLGRCIGYRGQNPNIARIVFSREPKVKTLQSITHKIEVRRQVDKSFSYDDLNDIVALTVLCPYDTDVPQFIEWMRDAFEVETSDLDALKDYPSGHRAHHYIIKPTDEEIANNPKFYGLRCEIQVKTLLQEAFDAKSHDLAYKPGRFDVGDDLKNQFGLLASALKAIDGQSEFLKSLIIREQKEVDLRRLACLNLFLKQDDTIQVGNRLKVDLTKNIPALRVVRILQRHSKKLDVAFCKFAAICALKFEHEMLREEAITYVRRLGEGTEPDRIPFIFARGGILWVLGRFEDAITDTLEVVRLATVKGDQEQVKEAKNNFIYYLCDWKLFQNQTREEWFRQAEEYMADLSSSGPIQGHEADTFGLFKILFGKSVDEIEEGRTLVKLAYQTRKNDIEIYSKFYDLHNYIALNRLIKMLRHKP